MIFRFKKDDAALKERSAYFRGPSAWINNILQITNDEANVLRWQENDDAIIVQFDRHPGEAAQHGRVLDSFVFDQPDKVVTFDMKRMFDCGVDEHPSATAERLGVICINYAADEATMRATMTVFDPFNNLPLWIIVR